MTTAPRAEETFTASLRSMLSAGFERPTIFAEPGAPVAEEFSHLPLVRRERRYFAWPNFFQGMTQLLAENATADAFMLAQDDVLFWPGDGRRSMRQILEDALWPSDDCAAVSLYTSSAYQPSSHGWHKVPRRFIWGACAIVFRRESLREFLGTTAARWTERGHTHKVDTAIGLWGGSRIYYPYPSLCRHIGRTSAISPRGFGGRRKEGLYIGDIIR